MKKSKVVTTVFLILFLAGCSRNLPQDIIVDKEELQTYVYQEEESLGKNIKISECEFPIPEHGQVDTFYVYNNVVYYSVGFSDYLENNTGYHFVQFEEKYNTQIRSFDMESKEDSLLYQYKEDMCIAVTDMQCNGTYLVWEDYKANEWNLQKFSLLSAEEPETIVSRNTVYESGTLSTITPTITEDSLYWYDQKDESDSPIALYQYEFETRKINIVHSNLDLSSPYTHVSILNDICTYFKKISKDMSTIYIYDLKGEEKASLTVPTNVSNPISNGEICVWLTGEDYYDRKMLYVYDLLEKTYEQIDVSDAFSYGILGDYLIVNRIDYNQHNYDGIFCYDVKSKTYLPLAGVENAIYGFTLHGLTGNIYASKWVDNKENSQKIINLSLY